MCQGSEYFGILKMSGFWIYQGSEYASGSEFASVLNMSGLHKALNVPDHVWLCLTGICLDMSENSGICMNMSE